MSIRVAGRYGFARPPMVKLFSQTLTAAGKFDVTGIPPSFSHLMFFTKLRSDVAATLDVCNFFLNGDTTAANYRNALHSAGSAHSSAVADDPLIVTSTGGSSPANYFQSSTGWLFFYSGADLKIITLDEVRREDATTIKIFQKSYQWESTAAIDQMTIQTDNDPTDELDTGSELQIWGIY